METHDFPYHIKKLLTEVLEFLFEYFTSANNFEDPDSLEKLTDESFETKLETEPDNEEINTTTQKNH